MIEHGEEMRPPSGPRRNHHPEIPDEPSQLAHREPFAGVWECWGEESVTCALITTEANDNVGPVHARMPVLPRPSDHALWLEPKASADHPHAPLRPFGGAASDKVVGRCVNSPGHEGPRCVQVDSTPVGKVSSLPEDKQPANDISWRQRPASVSLVA